MKALSRTAGTVADSSATPAETQEAIEKVLEAYEQALNASDVERVMTLFAPDGVFMAPNNPSAVGAVAIRAAYEAIFGAIAFATELQVAEIVQVAPTWAFVRTTSAGFVTVRANDVRIPDANHELFIFRKGPDHAWKIARYSFATTNPARP